MLSIIWCLVDMLVICNDYCMVNLDEKGHPKLYRVGESTIFRQSRESQTMPIYGVGRIVVPKSIRYGCIIPLTKKYILDDRFLTLIHYNVRWGGYRAQKFSHVFVTGCSNDSAIPHKGTVVNTKYRK